MCFSTNVFRKCSYNLNFRREHALHSLDGEGEEDVEGSDRDEDEEGQALVNKEEEEEEDLIFLEEQKSKQHNKFSFLNARPGVITYHIM